jgi:dTDP-4-dehydrorhamnose 3,5-epimerase
MDKITHRTFADHRGSYTPVEHDTLGVEWTQSCISVNDKKFTFRGMHYQTDPPQTKYVKVVRGSIVDFALDLATGELDSATLGPNDAVLIPPDKAHGFLTLEDDTIVVYLVQGVYSPASERSIVWSTHEQLRAMVESLCGSADAITISDKDRVGK